MYASNSERDLVSSAISFVPNVVLWQGFRLAVRGDKEVAKYRVLVGLDYPPNKRAEAGDIVSDLPSSSITWLLADGLIEEVEGNVKYPKKNVVAPKPEIVEETFETVVEESDEEDAE